MCMPKLNSFKTFQSIISGQTTIKQVLTAVLDKYRDEITKLVKDAFQIILQQIHSVKILANFSF